MSSSQIYKQIKKEDLARVLCYYIFIIIIYSTMPLLKKKHSNVFFKARKDKFIISLQYSYISSSNERPSLRRDMILDLISYLKEIKRNWFRCISLLVHIFFVMFLYDSWMQFGWQTFLFCMIIIVVHQRAYFMTTTQKLYKLNWTCL